MDHNKLRGIVLEKTGIKIDLNDPAFALVVLNEAILEEAISRHLALMHDATKRLGTQIHKLQQAADHYQRLHTGQDGVPLSAGKEDFEADDVDDADGAGLTDGAPGAIQAQHERASPGTPLSAPSQPPQDWKKLAATAGIALLSALTVLSGQWLFSSPTKSSPAAAPVATSAPPAPAPLSAEQSALLKKAEKMHRAMQKLDAKAKIQFQAEMDKP